MEGFDRREVQPPGVKINAIEIESAGDPAVLVAI